MAVLFVLVGSSFLVPGLDMAFYVLLSFHALRGPRQAVEALSILFIFLLGNPNFTTGGAKNFRYLVYLASFVRMIIELLISRRNDLVFSPSFRTLMIVCAVFLPVAILTSQAPLISTLKLVSFMLVSVSLLFHFPNARVNADYWQDWFQTLFLFMIMACILVLPLGMGYERNGYGFQGIFSHPQILGPVMGVIAAWFTWQMIAGRLKGLTGLMILSTPWVLLYLSQARTGVLAAGGGALLASSIFVLSGRRLPHQKQLITFAALLSLGVFFLLLLQPDRVTGVFTEFVQKRAESAESTSAIFQESRGQLVDASMANYRDNPIFGIGMGIPSNLDELRIGKGNSFMGIPLSASVEKGFFPSAVLEETGLLGAVLTLILILSILRTALKNSDFQLLWLGISALLINTGEAVFYSVGGTGLFVWLIFALANNGSKKIRSY